MSETTTSAGFDFVKLMENAKRFIVRTFRSDFQREHATDEERQQLAATRVPVTGYLAQDYAAWRRGVLWVLVAFLGVKCILEFISWIKLLDTSAAEWQVTGDIADTIKFVGSILFLIIPVTLTFYILAALKWTDLKRSRSRARMGWLIMFATPLALSGIPWPSIAGVPETGNAAQDLLARAGVGFIFGILLVIQVGPQVISLCVGVIRSSMVLKTLLPESSAPGWAAVLFAPLYLIIFTALVVLFNQMAGNLLLLIGFSCILAAPIVYVVRAKDIVRPHTPEEVISVIRPIRLTYTVVTLAGVALVGIFLIENLRIDVLDLLRLAIGFGSGILALIVVGSDFILAIINNGYQQSKEFHGSSLKDDLDAKFEALSEVGLTQMKLSYMTSDIDSSRIAEAVEQAKQEQTGEDEAE